MTRAPQQRSPGVELDSDLFGHRTGHAGQQQAMLHDPANDGAESQCTAAQTDCGVADAGAADQVKLEPEDLELRSQPQPVRRLSPRAVILLSLTGLSAIAGLTILALRPPRLKEAAQAPELYEAAQKPKASELDALPKSYEDWLEKIRDGNSPAAPEAIPQLGQPLPGDIGHAWAVQQGIGPARSSPDASSSYAGSSAMSAAQQRHMEQQRQVEQALHASLFFAGKAKTAATAEAPSGDAGLLRLLTRLDSAPNVAGNDALQPAGGGAASADPEEQAPSRMGAADAGMPAGVLPDTPLNPHALTPLASPYTLLAGSLIPAALIGDLNSDLPGMIQAQVTQNVYDSVHGRWLLIPQGARLIGRTDARVLFGQERAMVIWTRLILPDGASMMLEAFTGTDARGQAGLAGTVDVHSARLVKGILLSSLLGVGSELSLGTAGDTSLRALARALQDSGNSAGQEIIRRHLEVKPTIRVAGGTRLNVLVSRDLILKPWPEKTRELQP